MSSALSAVINHHLVPPYSNSKGGRCLSHVGREGRENRRVALATCLRQDSLPGAWDGSALHLLVPVVTLKQIVEDVDTPYGRIFDAVIQFLIIVSLIEIAVETLPERAASSRRVLNLVEIAIVSVFTLEYLCRLLVADSRIRFVFSFYGLLDLVAILPFYLSLGVDLRFVRALRLVRLVRVLKLARYSRAVTRFARAFAIAKEEVVLFFVTTLVLLYLASFGIYFFEHDAQPEAFASVFHSLWWAVATLTTVGYGDVYPVTAGGKVFTFVILMLGLGIVSVPAGLVASALSRARQEEQEAAKASLDNRP